MRPCLSSPQAGLRRSFLALLVLCACNERKPEPPPPAVTTPVPVVSAASTRPRYTVDAHGCALGLVLEGSTSATLTSACDLAKVARADLGALLDKALAAEKRRPLFTLLAIAGDGKDGLGTATPTIDERTAVAAIKSPRWDRRRGLPVAGYAEMVPLVRDLATPSVVVPELEAALHERGLCIANDTTDLIDTRSVAERSNRAELVALGALPIDKVPTFGTLAFFAWPAGDGGACGKAPSH